MHSPPAIMMQLLHGVMLLHTDDVLSVTQGQNVTSCHILTMPCTSWKKHVNEDEFRFERQKETGFSDPLMDNSTPYLRRTISWLAHTQKKLDNDSACDLTFKNLTNAFNENPALCTHLTLIEGPWFKQMPLTLALSTALSGMEGKELVKGKV